MGIALFSCIAAVLLSFRLQASLVEPILALARVTKRISLDQDFSVRARKYNHDEIGDLVDSFNQMVGEIEQASSALRESEERYQTLAEASPVGLLRVDTQGVFSYLNERSIQISGVSLEQFQQKGPFTGIHPEDLKEVTHQWLEASKKDLPLKQEYRYLHEDGEVAWVLSQAKPEFDERGVFLGYIGTLTDLTDRKRAEEERETLIGELEARNAEMEQFTYTVSHDLKSPLITVHGFLGLLQKDIEADNKGRIEVDIQHIENAVEKMGFLLEDLLALSRVGRIVNPSEKVNLADLVNGVVNLLSGIIKEREVQVKVDPNLPAVFVDRSRFEQVIQNLIENAIKFMGDQKSPCVEISVREDHGKPVCFVRDNGIGINPRYHDTVFGLFDRLNQAIDGTGIGLALVKRIIEVHHGKIWVESEGEGHGSSLCFTLPVDEVAEEERPKYG
jgi:PAS domain S-box-containing protein